MDRFKNTFDKMEDAQLLAAFSAYPNVVLAELYKRYHVRTFGLCINYLNDREKAKDAVSEIFMNLREDLNKHEVKSFKSWFYVYSKNHCLGYLRKAKTVKKHEQIWQDENDYALAPHHISEEDLNRLRNGLENLKKDQRECIRLFFYQKQSYTEIAGVLSISEKKVKSHLQNGKRNLRLFLEGFKQTANQKKNG